MPEDGSVVAEGGTAVAEAGTATPDTGSAMPVCYCEFPLGIKSFLKFKNKPIGQTTHISEI